MIYHNLQADRVKYKICKDKEELAMELEAWKQLARDTPFFKETVTTRGLIVYKIRDYKQYDRTNYVACIECGQIHKKDDIKDVKKRSDGTPYQADYTCPNCNSHIGYDWLG